MSKADKEYVVFLFGWNLLPLEDMIENFAAKTGLPKYYLHVGVGVFNKLYHFTQSGISVSFNMPEGYKVLSQNGDENHFITAKTLQGLENNLYQIRKKYTPATYDVRTNNCICFSREIFNFLGLQEEFNQGPFKHWELEEWLKDKNIIPLALGGLYSSLKLSPSSASFSNSSEASVDVFDTVSNLVSEAMEYQFKISNSGQRVKYNKEDGAVVES